MIKRDEYTIKFVKEYFEDKLHQGEIETKGCLFGTTVESNGNVYKLNFYDTTRFKQDTDDELEGASYVYDSNMIFLKTITLNNVIDAIDKFWSDYKTFNIMVASK